MTLNTIAQMFAGLWVAIGGLIIVGFGLSLMYAAWKSPLL